jgi:hypothetical protein
MWPENFSQRACIYVNISSLRNVVFGLASEMLFFLLASSLCMLVDCRVAIRLHLLPMFSTPELRRLLILLANVLSIPQGF